MFVPTALFVCVLVMGPTSGFFQVQGDLFNGKIGVERRDLLSQNEEVLDEEELPVHLTLGGKKEEAPIFS